MFRLAKHSSFHPFAWSRHASFQIYLHPFKRKHSASIHLTEVNLQKPRSLTSSEPTRTSTVTSTSYPSSTVTSADPTIALTTKCSSHPSSPPLNHSPPSLQPASSRLLPSTTADVSTPEFPNVFQDYHLDPISSPHMFLPVNLQLRSKSCNNLIYRNNSLHSHSINEAMSLIHLLIQSKKMQQAKEIYLNLWKWTPDTMQSIQDTNLFNLFMSGYVEEMSRSEDIPTLLSHVLEWFSKLKEKKLQPNATSYALLFRALVIAHQDTLLNSYLHEFKHTAAPDLLYFVLRHPLLLHNLNETQLSHWQNILKQHALVVSPASLIQPILDKTHPTSSQQAETILAQEVEQYQQKQLYADQLALPQTLPVQSIGLEFLQQNLQQLKGMEATQEALELHALQLKLETEAYEASFKQFLTVAENAPEALLQTKTLKKLMWDWHVVLAEKLKEEMDKHSDFKPTKGKAHLNNALEIDFNESPWAYLSILGPEKLAKLTILEALGLLLHKKEEDSTGGLQPPPLTSVQKLSRVTSVIGNAIMDEINAQELKKHLAMYNDEEKDASSIHLNTYLQERLYSSRKLFNMGLRKLHAQLRTDAVVGHDLCESATSNTPNHPLASGVWMHNLPTSLRCKLGAIVMKHFVETATIEQLFVDPKTGADRTERVPICFHRFEFERGKKVGVIQFHPAFIELFSKQSGSLGVAPKMLPMVVKPKPWLQYMNGGYLTSRSLCMRVKNRNPEQLAYLRGAAQKGRLHWVLASLDVLGETAWRINPEVLAVILEAWNSGESIADFPPHMSPEKIKEMEPQAPEDIETNPSAKMKYFNESNQFQSFVRNSFSLRCDNNYKLEIARSFLGFDLYFPHNLDFRGRAYPIPPLLNHMSNDLCRGLLTFAKSKKLGERGWFWLKVHLASLYGVDKESFSQREQWVMSNLDNIYDSVDKPLTGNRWWLQCDDPWQFLAACFEVTKAIRSGNPEAYECSLPIHQDGTCNGLQHYAALGGDLSGAKQVNLVKGDRPADVYLTVAHMVQRDVHEDAKKGNASAKLLDGKITRKIVKQTVMTYVYGVTFVGARCQIQARLKECMELDNRTLYATASYLASKVMKSIKHLFQRAQELQQWLNIVAQRIAHSVPKDSQHTAKTINSVVWTTPLGLTCAQPYRREKSVQVQTLFQSLSLCDPTHEAPVNSSKQKSAFPPNFIHSLDSSHMMLTAIECYRRGLTFASVHDSYWTHASDIDEMNTVIRKMFVKLHSQPILENLLKELQLRYQGYLMPLSLIKKKTRSNSKALDSPSIEESSKSDASAMGVEDTLSAEDTFVEERGLDLDADLDKAMEMMVDDEAMMDTSESDFSEASVVNPSDMVILKKNSRKEAYIPLEFPPLPRKGTFNIRQVIDSDYFFH